MSEIISVILPTYNRAHTLDRAIESVYNQSFSNWHLYIIDDASTDESKQVIESWMELSEKITLVPMPENLGVSAARNRGIKKSEGKFLSFLDSDDEWLPEKLFKQMTYFKNNPTCRIVHGEEVWVRNGTRVNPMKKHKKSGGWVFEDCLKLCCISPSTVMLSRDLIKEVGGFREDFPACEDYDLWLRICSREPVGFIDENLITKYGGHKDQLSRKYKAMDYWRVLALESLLKKQELSEDFYQKTLAELQRKKRVLLKGFRKHENLKNYDQIFSSASSI